MTAVAATPVSEDAEGGDAPLPKAPIKRHAARIVAAQEVTDPKERERERLLQRLLAAEGRPSITRAALDLREAGFELPRTQDVFLQLLEHRDEDQVCVAIAELGTILVEEPPRRRKVLDSRLRRIAEYADEPVTQRAAADLQRLLTEKYAETLDG